MKNLNNNYQTIFIAEDRGSWSSCYEKYNPKLDLVLTLDFGLKHHIEVMGGEVYYVDSLCPPADMQENNFLASDFFKKWHFDNHGKDMFTEYEIPFGFAFRIEIWSEFLYYVRLRANLEQLRKLNYQSIYLSGSNDLFDTLLHEMGLSFIKLNSSITNKKTVYYFDINLYMHDALHAKSLRNVIKNSLVRVFSVLSFWYDTIFKFNNNKKKNIYIQIYHPTKKIVDSLKRDSNLKVITSSLSKSKNWRTYLAQRLIPIKGRKNSYQSKANILLQSFKEKRIASLCLYDGTDITEGAFREIERKVRPILPESLRILHSVVNYVEKQPVQLEVMIANIGLVQTIVDCVLKQKGVPSYLIINGLMTGKFCDEAKYATYINSYSESIKTHYFENASHVTCLGDPRMDDYINTVKPNVINRLNPTVSIGTSGFNNLDLNSYVAVEFDFLFDILSAFHQLQEDGSLFNLIIKVRPNGFLNQYIDFSKEYFPNLDIEIVREVPIRHVLEKSDLYISIYSQTLFEASCLGVPVIYYKKDKEILNPPFDGKSELVTVSNIKELKEAFHDFQSDHNRYNDFITKSVMEKYVGPLDGKNLDRNLAFIHNILNKTQTGAAH